MKVFSSLLFHYLIIIFPIVPESVLKGYKIILKINVFQIFFYNLQISLNLQPDHFKKMSSKAPFESEQDTTRK